MNKYKQTPHLAAFLLKRLSNPRKFTQFLFAGQFLKLRSDGDLGVPAEEKLVLPIVEEVDPLTLLTQVLPGQ